MNWALMVADLAAHPVPKAKWRRPGTYTIVRPIKDEPEPVKSTTAKAMAAYANGELASDVTFPHCVY